jgi:arsenate reductase (thioredoxin)
MQKRILFVCIENSNRSQMAHAFANMLGNGIVKGYSAGSKPSGVVNPKAIAAMAQLGYDLSAHHSKPLEETKADAPFDAVVTMGCGDACPWMPAKKTFDWQIPDPKNLNPDAFNEVRDLIREKVAALVHELLLDDVNLDDYFEKGMTYEAYRALTASLVGEGKTTGSDQSERYIGYTQLNEQRMKRGDKTVQLLPEMKQALEQLQQPLRLLVITEAWCGDAAQLLPVFQQIAAASPLLQLRLVLRDENLPLMDAFLTNGKSRSIPVLIAMNGKGEELFHWGSQPAEAKTLVSHLKATGMEADAVKEKLHLWYAKNRGIAVQQELVALLQLPIVP